MQYIGDHIEGNSPVDISFWPIHPTLERLVQYKNLVSPFSDYATWWSNDESDTNSYGWGSEGCKWGTTFGTDCDGHYADSLTVAETTTVVLGDAASSSSSSSDSSGSSSSTTTKSAILTNREILDLQLPEQTQKLSYVYESFTWEHCESDGVKFPSVASADTSSKS